MSFRNLKNKKKSSQTSSITMDGKELSGGGSVALPLSYEQCTQHMCVHIGNKDPLAICDAYIT